MVEKPDRDKAPSNIAILGRYIITPEIFEYLENAEPGKGGEIQLTDALRKLLAAGPVYAYDFPGKHYDVGNKLGFLEATVEFALKNDDLREDFLSYLREIVEPKQ
jgi:UTP--glucose-1-phosphate uridylyltransferase